MSIEPAITTRLDALMDEIQVATQIAATFRDSPDGTLRAQGIETHSRQEGLDRLADARAAVRNLLGGFTREDVVNLREVIAEAEANGNSGWPGIAKAESLADRIEALLPPEK